MRRAPATLLFALSLGVGCTSTPGADAGSGRGHDPSPPRIPVTVTGSEGDVTFQAEVADSPDERQRGLMFREAMADEEAMLFLFPDEQPRSFWMKNTLISLDMLFIRSDKTVLGIVKEAEPETTTGRSVPGNSQFVLEINGGLAEKLGLSANDEVRFVAPIPAR